jgi:hypothetical protein
MEGQKKTVYVVRFYGLCLFSVALRPNAGHDVDIYEVS